MVRFKNRYLTVLVKQLSDNNKSLCDIGITEKQFFEALVVSLQINFGDYGLAMNMTSLHCHKEALSETIKGGSITGTEYTFIVRCARDHNKTVHAAIIFITEIENRRVTCSVLKKRGVIRNMKNNKKELATIEKTKTAKKFVSPDRPKKKLKRK